MYDGVITRFHLAQKSSRSTCASWVHVFDHCDWPRLDLKTVGKTTAENIRILNNDGLNNNK